MHRAFDTEWVDPEDLGDDCNGRYEEGEMGGEGEAANFARRSPYPMINLLRTPQVRDAQKGIPTGAVYDVNERNMATVGTETLREMLQARDWTGLEGRSWEPHPTRAKLETKARQNF